MNLSLFYSTLQFLWTFYNYITKRNGGIHSKLNANFRFSEAGIDVQSRNMSFERLPTDDRRRQIVRSRVDSCQPHSSKVFGFQQLGFGEPLADCPHGTKLHATIMFETHAGSENYPVKLHSINLIVIDGMITYCIMEQGNREHYYYFFYIFLGGWY